MRLFHKCNHSHAGCLHDWYQKEEHANTVTHFAAFILGLVAFALLIIRAAKFGSTETVVACAIYAACVLSTFLASAIYHVMKNPRLKRIFHILDHIVIYLMIAGTYTPFTLITLRGPWGWSLFGVIWGLTIIGFIFKLFFTGHFTLLSTAIYVLMGWMAIVAIVPIIHALPAEGLFWLVLGGVLYTIGVVFFLMETIPFAHTIWHLFVIAGALAHFMCVYLYVAVA